jgi:hypothetical protein
MNNPSRQRRRLGFLNGEEYRVDGGHGNENNDMDGEQEFYAS